MKRPSVFGKYLLLERLNVGGMAEVFIAKAFGVEGFERILAIKKILPTMAEDAEFIRMFIDEARISVQLSHANIVQIHELGRYDDAYFIALEYVPGKDLRALLEWYRGRREVMPTTQAVFIASRMCEGLDYAHRKRDARGQELHIIHRDVSPQNILISYDGAVKLIDFGIAKAANRSQKTQAGILKGKFGYMSPEQVRGLPIDRRSDVFAVGVVFYEMLTGEKLFVGESDFSTLEMVRDAHVPAMHQFNPRIPPALEKVVLRALAREPADRYQWASDFQEDLMRFLFAGDTIYSAKQVGSLMREAFAEEILREEERMERFASIERPEEIGISGVTTGMVPALSQESLTAPPAVTVLSGSGRGRMDASSSGSELDPGDDEDSSGTHDRTQIFDATLADAGPVPGESLTKIAGVAELEGAHTQGPKGLSEPANVRSELEANGSDSADAHTDEAPTGATADSEERRGRRQQVIIGEPRACVGATVIGPQPVREAAVDDEAAPQPGLETRLAPLPDEPDSMPLGADAADITDTHGRVEIDEESEPTLSTGKGPAMLPLVRTRVAALLRRKVVIAAEAAVLLALVGLAGFLLRGEETGYLVVAATPDSAQISVGMLEVKNRFETEIPVGQHELQAFAAGFKAHRQQITVTAGKKLALVVELQAEAPPAVPSGSAAIPQPPEAGLDEDLQPSQGGSPAAQEFAEPPSPSKAPLVPGGPPKGAAAESRPVQVASPREPSRTAPVKGSSKPGALSAARALPKGKGKLACATRPAGAEVWVDGKSTGRQTPVPLSNPIVLSAGPHRVIFKINGKESGPHGIDVNADETVKLTGIVVE